MLLHTHSLSSFFSSVPLFFKKASSEQEKTETFHLEALSVIGPELLEGFNTSIRSTKLYLNEPLHSFTKFRKVSEKNEGSHRVLMNK